MKVKIKMKTPVLNMLKREMADSLEMAAEAVKTDVIAAQVIPFDEGTMQNESTFVDGKEKEKGTARIVTDTPYARRMYFHPEYKFQTVNNPNAKGEWYEDWLHGKKKDFAQRAFNRIYKKRTGI